MENLSMGATAPQSINEYQPATSLSDKRFIGETEVYKDTNGSYHAEKDSRKWGGKYQGDWVKIEDEKELYVPQFVDNFVAEKRRDYKELCDELMKVYYPKTEDLPYNELSKTLLTRHAKVEASKKTEKPEKMYYTNAEKIRVCNYADGERITQKMIKEKFGVSPQTLTAWQELKAKGELKA